ncbi:MAG TPA: OmpA family protein [Geminicoccaceae bacterium]|nr:OmpA family protein [Geminicoccaceae bacterium]
MRNLGRLGLAATLVATGACTFDPEPLDQLNLTRYEFDAIRTMEPQGPPFNRGLRVEYIKYADSEYVQHDFSDWYHFMLKATNSAKGFQVLPDEVASRTIPDDHVGELTEARARLMTVLDANARRRAAAFAARAQAAYDCWLEQQEENHQPEDIAACRSAFEDALAGIELDDGSKLYLIFFAWDQAELSPVAERVVDQIVADYRQGRPTRLLVAGHADRSGPADYNLRLSERRARSVADRLVQGGIDPAALDVRWLGEEQPRVPTEDGGREPETRRVEVTFLE